MDMDDEDIHVAKTTLADIAEFSENTTQGREKLGSIQVFMLSENRDCNFFLISLIINGKHRKCYAKYNINLFVNKPSSFRPDST